MWTAENRVRYERKGLRYESDLTDEEYALIEPFLPPERSVCRRSLVNGILYVLTTGCQWRQLPKDFPPKSTTHDYYVELNVERRAMLAPFWGDRRRTLTPYPLIAKSPGACVVPGRDGDDHGGYNREGSKGVLGSGQEDQGDLPRAEAGA